MLLGEEAFFGVETVLGKEVAANLIFKGFKSKTGWIEGSACCSQFIPSDYCFESIAMMGRFMCCDVSGLNRPGSISR